MIARVVGNHLKPIYNLYVVVVAGTHLGGAAPQALPPRHTVQLRVNNTSARAPVEVLTEVKKMILKAVVVHILPSGNIKATLLDKAVVERVYMLPNQLGITILRQDYLVEVTTVLRDLQVAYSKAINNTQLAAEICAALKTILLEL